MEKKTILLADAALFFIGLERTFLLREDFELRTAHTGAEALAIVAAVHPDIVFLDLYMAEMNGDECCRRIKAAAGTRKIPVVMVMAGVKEEDEERCRQAGCDDIIFKPIDPEQFIATAKKYLQTEVRLLPRYAARMRVNFGQDACQLLADYTLNLSYGGVFLETQTLLPEGSPLAVEFVLPTRDLPIRCQASVAWVNHPQLLRNPNLPAGMGIRFLGLSTEATAALRSYIHEENLVPLW